MEFDTEGLCPEKLARVMARPAPLFEYCIYFTPRSGSSWLTDLASRSGYLGSPIEAFNPNFAPRIAKSLNVSNMEEYVAALRRRFSHRRAFGLEITLYQMHATFGGSEAFMGFFGSAIPYWLIREDVVAQAVSLWKMQATGIAHSVEAAASERAAAEQHLSYDAAGILRWLDHITRLEAQTEAHFAAHDLDPLRLSYEQMMARGPDATRTLFARIIRRRAPPPRNGPPQHVKLGTSKNAAFVARFRQENAALCTAIDADRSAMLGKLHWDWASVPIRAPRVNKALTDPGTTAASGFGSDASACAMPSPRSGGCVRG